MHLEFSKVGSSIDPNHDVILIVEDEMVDNGIDRVLKRIADLESKMDISIASLRSAMDARFNVIDDRFKVVDEHLKTIEVLLPIKIAFITIAIVAAYAAIFGG